MNMTDLANGRERAERISNEGASVPAHLKQVGCLPPWYDPEKIKKGQEFFRENFFVLVVCKLAGLILVLAIPSILKVLIMTKKSSSAITAYKRYTQTIYHVLMWYDGDFRDQESRAYKSLMTVRGFHSNASNKASCSGFGHITQKDMALTQFGFIGLCMVNFKLLGIKGTRDQLEGFVHFWKVVGYIMGVSEKYNLCAESIEETEEACHVLLKKTFVPNMASNDPDFNQMTSVLLEGMQPVVPILEKDGFMAYTRYLCGMEHEEYLANFTSRLVYNLLLSVHKILLSSLIVAAVFRPLVNFLLWSRIVLCRKYPIVTSIHFGKMVSAMDKEVPILAKPKIRTLIRTLSQG